ncbi:MAG: hypothetical protein AAGF47_03225 [Planctomycetota bacterium]
MEETSPGFQHSFQPWAANRLGLDYRAEAMAMGDPVVPIVDVHVHVNGRRAAEIYDEAAALFGVRRSYTQTIKTTAHDVRDVLGDRIRWIATPNYMADDKAHAFTEGFIEDMRWWHGEFGARMVKFWVAPRLRDFSGDLFDQIKLDGVWKRKAAELARELGMMIMTHVADPDTWFQTAYADASRYGTKRQQYEPLERMLTEYSDVPWLAAHMAGSPEDLVFLDELLTKHDNLHIDTSATKWQVRELSKHEPSTLRAFFEKWQGRVLFGTDIVTQEAHLEPTEDGAFAAGQASNADEAFELYASRFWAMRMLIEADFDGESPIADPDLMKVDPERHNAMSAPRLRGMSLGGDALKSVYAGACEDLVERWYDEH